VKKYFITLVLSSSFLISKGQGITRYTYHDTEKKKIKEVYQVKDTISNILQGRYVSYFLNGHIESKGQFYNNETTGVWEFYYESGNLQMRGILRQNSNYGVWEYFYENGQKSMEGAIEGRLRERTWKIYYESGELRETGEYKGNKRTGSWLTYFEDGAKKGEITYLNDYGKFTEYYRSGAIFAEGPKAGTKNVGHWRTYAEDGTFASEGEYNSGKKNGEWKFYYPSGKLAALGQYESEEPVGLWTYYFESGKVSSQGEFVKGNKNGYWNSFNKDGTLRSEITYVNGTGEYKEYYPSGQLRIKGQMVNEKNQGKWQYFFDDGKLEGECDFDKGKGTYYGYYPNGSLQTKGEIVNDLRVGTWDLYEQDGNLTGYYKPIYESKNLADAINSMAEKSRVPLPYTNAKKKYRAFSYFEPRDPEYRSVIIQGNPAFMFAGFFPLGIEFYNQERLGHEFSFEGIRDPFFSSDGQVSIGKNYTRGYAFSLKQKFYNPWKTGMWYFAHEIRFSNIGHYANIPFNGSFISITAPEQRVEYSVLLGSRLLQRSSRDGFTLDAFVGYGVGYRDVSIDEQSKQYFSSVQTDHFSHVVRFGLNIGYSFSFDTTK
jgi:uncharacterized protein